MATKPNKLTSCGGPGCKRTFPPKKGKKYCSDECRLAAWNAAHPRVTLEELTALQQKAGG